MHGDNRRLENHAVSGSMEPKAQVRIFAIHEEILIEPTQAFESRATDQKASSRYPLNRSKRIVSPAITNKFVSPRSARTDSMQKRRPCERGADTREPPLRKLESAIF